MCSFENQSLAVSLRINQVMLFKHLRVLNPICLIQKQNNFLLLL